MTPEERAIWEKANRERRAAEDKLRQQTRDAQDRLNQQRREARDKYVTDLRRQLDKLRQDIRDTANKERNQQIQAAINDLKERIRSAETGGDIAGPRLAAAQDRQRKVDRGLAQIRRDWLEMVLNAQRILSDPPEPPGEIEVPEWLGEGDDAFAMLVHPVEYILDGTWKRVEQVADPAGKCHVLRDDSYKFSDALTAWDDFYPTWRDSLGDLVPIEDFELIVGELWKPMGAGFDREIWMPGRVRVADVDEIAEALAVEIEAVKKWNADWIGYLLDAENHGGGLVGEEVSGTITGVFGCMFSERPGPIQIGVPSGRPGDPTGSAGWGEFKARIEATAEALAQVPPACARAVNLIEDLKGAIRPFRHGKQFAWRGE